MLLYHILENCATRPIRKSAGFRVPVREAAGRRRVARARALGHSAGGKCVVVCWRVGAMVCARRGAVAAAGRQHVPFSTACCRRASRGGFDSPARALPHQPQKQPPPLRVVLLSSLCRRRLLSSPSSFAVAVLLSPLCRRGLFCPFSFFVAVIPPASRPLLVSSLCRRRLPAAATAGAQRHRRWDRRRCRPWARGWRRPRRCVPPPAARSCASTCPRRRTPRCTRACRWRPVRALPARAGAPALVEGGGGDNQQERRRVQK